MKIKRISLIAALTVASVLAGSMLASAQDNKETKKGGRGASVEQRLDQMTQDLKLTDEQKLDAAGDLSAIRAQVAKKNPSPSAIRGAWDSALIIIDTPQGRRQLDSHR